MPKPKKEDSPAMKILTDAIAQVVEEKAAQAKGKKGNTDFVMFFVALMILGLIIAVRLHK